MTNGEVTEMRRLLRFIALLPMITLIIIGIYELLNENPQGIPDAVWFVVALICLPAGIINLNAIRDGIIGLMYSAVISNFLFLIAFLATKNYDPTTMIIFTGYLIVISIIVLIDVIYDRFLSLNKSTDVFSSFNNKDEYRINNEK